VNTLLVRMGGRLAGTWQTFHSQSGSAAGPAVLSTSHVDQDAAGTHGRDTYSQALDLTVQPLSIRRRDPPHLSGGSRSSSKSPLVLAEVAGSPWPDLPAVAVGRSERSVRSGIMHGM